MYRITFTYRRRRGQRPDRYPDEQESVFASRDEIEAKRSDYGVPKDATGEDLAKYVAFDKRDSRAFGRSTAITVERLMAPAEAA